jgi:hypothetical protein
MRAHLLDRRRLDRPVEVGLVGLRLRRKRAYGPVALETVGVEEDRVQHAVGLAQRLDDHHGRAVDLAHLELLRELRLAAAHRLNEEDAVRDEDLAPRRRRVVGACVHDDETPALQLGKPVRQPLPELPPRRLHRVVPPTLQPFAHAVDP